MASYFEVKLKRSGASRPGTQRKTLLGLGLSRFGKTVFLKDTPAVRGMLYKVVHLVDVTPRDGQMPAMSSRARAEATRAESRG
jgi:large subunit ribosomal protein L30